MLIVGLTGGIGSGKSTVAEVFKQLGIPVYEADSRAKSLMNSPALQERIKAVFGDLAFQDGQLNRQHLASVVFNNKDMLDKLNAIVHPAVRQDFERWQKQQDAPYTIREAAILYESGSYKDCEKVIAVTAPEELRISRVMKRDGVSRDQVLSRMENQWPEERKNEMADFVVNNDETLMLLPQVMNIHQELLKLSES